MSNKDKRINIGFVFKSTPIFKLRLGRGFARDYTSEPVGMCPSSEKCYPVDTITQEVSQGTKLRKSRDYQEAQALGRVGIEQAITEMEAQLDSCDVQSIDPDVNFTEWLDYHGLKARLDAYNLALADSEAKD